MEKRTIGQFIAALRKANGLTQRELAEKLNVTDKTVSRWERDESLPDLTLIPVLAEIFEATSDEILKGERITHEKSDTVSAVRATEKQIKYIIDRVLLKFNIRSIVAFAVAVVGLIAAMICDFGFLRAYIGFFVASLFFVGAITIQVINAICTFASFKDTESSFDRVNKAKRKMFSTCCVVISSVLTLFTFTLPLVTKSYNAYVGLSVDYWFSSGIVAALICAAVCFAACYILRLLAAKKHLYEIENEERKEISFRLRFCGKRTLILCVVLLVTFAVHSGVADMDDLIAESFSKCEKFTNLDEFKAYIEKENEWEYGYYDRNPGFSQDVIFGAPVEIEGDGETDYQTGAIYDKYGDKILLTYKHKNLAVVRIICEWDKNENLLIKTYTNSALQGGYAIFNIIMYTFVAAYIAEVALTVIFGMKKYKKLISKV